MKIYEAAILALKKLGKSATYDEILNFIIEERLYEFNTADKKSVLQTQIQRRCEGYNKSGASAIKYFKIVDKKVDLLPNPYADPEVKENKDIVLQDERWKDKREVHIKKVNAAFARNQLSLFLGAGVSSSATLPDWNALIKKLNLEVVKKISRNKDKWAIAQRSFTKEDYPVLSKMLTYLKADDSSISNAHFFEIMLAEDKEQTLSPYIRNILYEQGEKEYNSPLLKMLAKLCIPKSYHGIRSVVTFNFDDLLEQNLHEYTVKAEAIFKEDVEISPDCLPIYHVHGYLPQHDKSFDDEEENLIVFSEKAYHTVYTDAYSWSNIIQLYTLKESICLFVGISFKDPNMRRLLDIASRRSKRNVKHFALMQRKDLENAEELLDKDLKSEISKQSNLLAAFLEDIHVFKEIEFREMGIEIIWYNDHSEIPEIIRNIIG